MESAAATRAAATIAKRVALRTAHQRIIAIVSSRVLVIATVAGCSFSAPTVDVLPTTDGPGTVEPVELVLVDSSGPWIYNTDNHVLTDPAGGMHDPPSTMDPTGVRVIQVDRFAMRDAVTLRVVGVLPLRIVSTTTIDLDAGSTLDVASYWNGTEYARGAGLSTSGDGSGCGVEASGPGVTCSIEGASGGGGGGFGGAGGPGGEGGVTKNCGTAAAPGGAGGGAATAPTAMLRAGCAGKRGGNSLEQSGELAFGAGGPGGGAIALVAGTVLTIRGATIRAGGAGGRGSSGFRAGGGGGGSGGTIDLRAPMITLASPRLVANGGGGGGGSDHGVAMPGEDALFEMVAAGGARGDGSAGNGSAGGFGTDVEGVPGVAASRGAGGGGGGAGVIVIAGTVTATGDQLISPAAMQP